MTYKKKDGATTLLGRASMTKRDKLKLSIRAAAKASGFHHATLLWIENGGKPSIPTFLQMMTWLKVPTTKYAKYLQDFAE